MEEKRKALLKLKTHFATIAESLDEIRATMTAHDLFDMSRDDLTELAEDIANWRLCVEGAIAANKQRFEENMEDARQQGNAAADEELRDESR